MFFRTGEEVVCLPVILVLDAARRRRIPVEELLADTGLDPAALGDPAARIRWHTFVSFLGNAKRVLGDSGLASAGRSFPTSHLGRPLIGRTSMLSEPADLYRLASRPRTGFFEIDFACIRFELREPGPGTLTLELRYEEGYEPSAELHALLRGVLEGIPGFIGFPNASASVESTPDGARFCVSLPAHPDGLIRRLQHRLRKLRARRVPAQQLGWALIELEARSQQLAHALEDQQREAVARASSEDHFAKIFHASPAAACLMRTSDGLVIDINESLGSLVGRRHQEVVGRNARSFPWSDPEEIARLEEAVDGDPHLRDFPARIVRPDGEVRHALLSREPVAIDGEPHVIWQAADVTDRERAADVLREAEQTYFDLYENAPDMYVLVELETGRIRRCNRKLCETLGLARSTLEHASIDRFLESDSTEELRVVLDRLRETGSLRNVRLRMRRDRGDAFDVSVSGSAVRSPDGKVRETRLIIRNLNREDPAHRG